MRRFPSGSYPDKGISEARSEARTLHTRVKQHGADPVAERRRERAMAAAAKQGVGTLGALLDLYGEKRGSSQRGLCQLSSLFGATNSRAAVAPLKQLPAYRERWLSGACSESAA